MLSTGIVVFSGTQLYGPVLGMWPAASCRPALQAMPGRSGPVEVEPTLQFEMSLAGEFPSQYER